MILEKPRNITQESERDLLGKVKEDASYKREGIKTMTVNRHPGTGELVPGGNPEDK